MTKEKSTLRKILHILLCVLCVVLLVASYFLTIHLVMNRTITLSVCSYTKDQKQDIMDALEQEYNTTSHMTLSNHEYRKIIEHELNFHLYTYEEIDLPGATVGRSNIYYRKIIIDTNRHPHGYARTFTHEVFHIKKCSVDETFIAYETFKFLYEHDNPYLRVVGVSHALGVFYNMFKGGYDIEPQLMYYFLNEQGENKCIKHI